jgi:hypothetical protein
VALADFHGGGRMPVRNVLYMAALSACRDNPALKIFPQPPRRRSGDPARGRDSNSS